MSGPPATAKPSSAKMAMTSSVAWLTGWIVPRGSSAAGSVTSTFSEARRASSEAASSAFLRAAMASAMRSRRPLNCTPLVLRSSGLIVPSVFKSSAMLPFFPRAATRTSSSARSLPAPSTAAIRSRSSWTISVMKRIPHSRLPHPRAPDHYRSGAVAACLKRRSARAGGLTNQCLEGLGLSHGEIGQYLAVDRDPGALEAADKSAVGQAMLAHRGVDALNPQGAEVALLQLAPDIGVLHRTIDGGIGAGDRVLAAAVEAFGLLEDAFSAAVR